MFFVCDATMRVLSDWSNLWAAKASARVRATEYPGQVFFVCGNDGRVIASFGE